MSEYFVIMSILGSVCFITGTAATLYLAYKLVEMCKLSQAALSAMFESAATHLASKTVIEKAQHDSIQADTDIRLKILSDSLEVERQRAKDMLEAQLQEQSEHQVLSDGRVIKTSEWTQV